MKKITSRKKRKLLRKIKIICLLLVIGVSIFSFRMVDALDNDSIIERNRVDNIYAFTNYDNINHLFYLNMYTLNGIPAYCIELGVNINTEVYNSTYDFSVSNLSNSKINYIRNLSYFGYGYEGHNDYRYYMATQELMWEYLNGIEVEWTNELEFDGERINIDRYKNDILSLVNRYNRGFDLRGYYDGMNVNIGNTIDITDVNNNINDYVVVKSDHSQVRINNNMIYIDFDKDYVGEENIVLERKGFYNYDGRLYYQGSNQKLISNGNFYDEQILSFNVNGMGLSMEIVDSIDIKKNSQIDYSGIFFELYNEKDELVERLDGSSSKLFVDNLVYGNYYIRQVSTNDYYFLNEEDYYFEFNEDTGVIMLEVTPVVRRLELLKLYGDSNNVSGESGAFFNIYNIDGTLYDSVVTGSNGIGSIDLPYGEYIVKQVSGRNGYYMVDDFSVSINKSSNDVLKYTLVDNLIETNLVINSKVDSVSMIEEGILYKIKKVGSGDYLEYDDNNEFVSIDGKVKLPFKISYGEYIIEVINNSKNYVEVEDKIEFKVDDNSNFNFIDGELYLDIDILYEEVKGSIEVNSYIEEMMIDGNNFYYDYVIDEDVFLSLVADNDIVLNGNVIYNKGNNVGNVTTDKDGKYLIKDIYLGNYCLVDLEGDKVCFEVIGPEIQNISFNKELDKGQVIIHNLSNKLENIEGTVMELYDKGNNLIYIGITNSDGIIKVNNLSYGEYCFLEKSVGNNYIINKEELCFVIESDNVELEITNRKVDKKYIFVPDTFSDKKSIRKLLVLCLILMGGSLYKIKTSKSR